MSRVEKVSRRRISTCGSSGEDDYVAQSVAALGGGDRVVDPIQRIATRDKLVELERSRAVVLDELRNVVMNTGAAHLGAENALIVRRDAARIDLDRDPRRGNPHQHYGARA